VTRGQLPQRAGSLGLNGGGTAAVVTPQILKTQQCKYITILAANFTKKLNKLSRAKYKPEIKSVHLTTMQDPQEC